MNYKRDDWNFLNMNSPADLHCEYETGDRIKLWEYDRCRDGHCLVSSFQLNAEDAYFETEVLHMDDGIGIGLYYGDGCYSRYVLAALCRESLELRIPNNVPLGDTFRFEGAKRYYTAAEREVEAVPPFLLGIKKEGDSISLWLNGTRVLEKTGLHTDFLQGNPRIMVKALNESGKMAKASAVLGTCQWKEAAAACDLHGQCLNAEGKAYGNICIHVRGDFNKAAKSGSDGCFTLPALPCGSYALIAGCEGKGFAAIPIEHKNQEIMLIRPEFKEDRDREKFPQTELKDSHRWMGLNGVWKFDFDKEEIGEQEGWYQPHTHNFSRCIQVPFSWQSLKAFGEEALMEEYSLHQANPFTCCPQENGSIGWYQRSLKVSGEYACAELTLGAVSGISKIWLDGKELGCTVDSYNRFTFLLGELSPLREYNLTVMVRYLYGNDFCCMGKQGFWFTDSPGIWQNVWLRERSGTVIRDIQVEVQHEQGGSVRLTANALCDILIAEETEIFRESNQYLLSCKENGIYRIDLDYEAEEGAEAGILMNGKAVKTVLQLAGTCGYGYYDKKTVYLYLEKGIQALSFQTRENNLILHNICAGSISADSRIRMEMDTLVSGETEPVLKESTGEMIMEATFTLENPRLWSALDPYQYELRALVSRNKNVMAEYARKVGIRRFEAKKYKNSRCRGIALNGQRIYIRGVLDQGYNPWGLYTYPALEKESRGSAAFDIGEAKRCGYNLVRMHIKDNEPDWYRLCDEAGLLVWDEHPVNFYGVSGNKHWLAMYQRQLNEMIRKHNYHPSVVMFSTFNESWGITGNHEKSPWQDAGGQRVIKEAAAFYKRKHPGVLVVDNSGYGKTAETDIIDFHSYPGGYGDARDFFRRLEEQNIDKSCFNFYNKANVSLMQRPEIRDLLQRNCSDDLTKLKYVGEERQKEQPVLISEFVHTDGIEQMIRIFPEFAGYIRMNLASQENEDTSPLTAGRQRRSFGLVRSDFSEAGYKQINSENLIYLDYPFLTKQKAGEKISIPVYGAVWKNQGDTLNKKIRWSLTSIGRNGDYTKEAMAGGFHIKMEKYHPECVGKIELLLPGDSKGAYLFAELLSGNESLAETYVQFEVFGTENTEGLCLNPCDAREESLHGNCGQYNENGRHLYWLYGTGRLHYEIDLGDRAMKEGTLVFEMSSCECMDGTRETDENLCEGIAEILVNGISAGIIRLEDHPCDRLALFSNSSSSEGVVSDYKKTGKYGYGHRYEIALTSEMLREIRRESKASITFCGLQQGLVLYGNRMGRYGCDPEIRYT